MTSYKSKRYRSRCNLGIIDDVLNWKYYYGYFAGGSTGQILATTDHIMFSTGSTGANTSSNLSQARYGVAGLSDGITYGYFAGGWATNDTVITDRIIFSNGATSVNTVSNLSQAKDGLAGLPDGVSYGYFAG